MKTYFKVTLLVICFTSALHSQNFALEWATSAGGIGADRVDGLAIDDTGNVYAIGYFEDVVDVDPGAATLNFTSSGSTDVVVYKLDPLGNLVWAKQFGGDDDDMGSSIAIDNVGNIYLTGYIGDTVDMDPGSGIFNFYCIGNRSAYVLKLNNAGNFIWAKQMSSAWESIGYSIQVDDAYNVYTSGRFHDTTDFDPGAGTFYLTTPINDVDVFVSKLNASGNFVWAKQVDGADNSEARKMTIDPLGNIYTCGHFYGTSDFDPGAGTFNLTSAGDADGFILALNNNGNFIWAKQLGGTDIDFSFSISLDASDNIITTGVFNSTADFDPGAGIFNMTTASSNSDVFISKLTNNGDFIWAKQIGGMGLEGSYSSTIDQSGNIYTAGWFSDLVDFDSGPGTFDLTPTGILDFFITKLDAIGNFLSAVQLGGDQLIYPTYIVNDTLGNLYTSGAFSSTVDFDPQVSTFNLTANGNEDIFVHKMSYCYATTNSLNISTCNSFTSSGNSFAWYSSGNYQDTLINANGCDSILSINLTINYPSYSVITPTACSSYTSPSGNHIWTTSGLYHDTIPNVGGCDSAITIFLIINNTVNNVVTVCNTLISNATNATYQWLDCDNNYAIIPGETDQMFSASTPGNYAVEITQGSCIDTSACNAITTVGLIETDGSAQSLKISIYPNPTNTFLTIQTNAIIQSVFIYNTLGSLVQTETKNSFSVAQLASGIYILQIKTEHGLVNASFVKE